MEIFFSRLCFFFSYDLLERRIDSHNVLIDVFPVLTLDNDSWKKGKRKCNSYDKNGERSIN